MFYDQILAYDSTCRDLGPLFRVPVTVCVPLALDDNFELTLQSLQLQPGKPHRIFVQVPVEAAWAGEIFFSNFYIFKKILEFRIKSNHQHQVTKYMLHFSQIVRNLSIADSETKRVNVCVRLKCFDFFSLLRLNQTARRRDISLCWADIVPKFVCVKCGAIRARLQWILSFLSTVQNPKVRLLPW